MQTIIIPGAGEANIDTMVENPFERANQRREKEVYSLLDKLPPATIGMHSIVGLLSEEKKEEEKKSKKRRFGEIKEQSTNKQQQEEEEEVLLDDEEETLEKKRQAKIDKEEERKKERKKGMKKFRLKHKNIKTIERELLREKIEAMKKAKKGEEQSSNNNVDSNMPAAFALFTKKKKNQDV